MKTQQITSVERLIMSIPCFSAGRIVGGILSLWVVRYWILLLTTLLYAVITVNASAGIVISGTVDLPALQTYVQNMTIQHPGAMNSLEELQFIKDKIIANQEPWKTYYTNLTKSGYSKLALGDPGASAVPTQEWVVINAAYVIYNQTLLYYFTGNETYAQNAVRYLNAWSSTLQDFSGVSNWYLAPAWVGSIIAPAAELLRTTYPGWTSAEIAQCQAMFNRAFLPVLKFRYAYGNRELSVANGLLAIGLFNDDKAAIYMGLYHWVSYVPCHFYLSTDGTAPTRANYFTAEPTANTYWAMHSDLFPTQGDPSDWLYTYTSSYPNYPFAGKGDDRTMMTMPGTWTIADQWYMGTNLHSIPNPVPAYVDGQCGETFRDLGHVEFAFSAAINVAELAWQQGIDLYSAYANRFGAFMELHSSFRLSNPLPPALALSGTLNPGDGMAAPMEIAYNHFHDGLGMDLPNTLQLLSTIRSELWYRTAAPVGIFANGLWGQEYYHILWESLLHQGLPPEYLFPTAGLVAHYQLEQNSNDCSTFANVGSGTAGFTYSADAMQGVYSGTFNGTGARVVVPDSDSLRITGNLTVATWVKANSFATTPNLIAKSFNTGYRLRLTTAGKPYLILGSGTSVIAAGGTTAITPGNWNHVAATVSISGSAGTVKFYVNGGLTTTCSIPITAITSGTGPLVLGTRRDITSSTESLSGLLDQVTIYNRALSDSEISDLAQ